ncbi:MAG: flagellar basal body rod protein FlgC [Sedimentisphaerales bacterium]|jgi:flagellar basal-body rod protein FlgC|nr:flagellar basal body rod protein FlgC [Sedimentisphaerales bacterium]HNY79277.1 flagellar basal body rod protein FlgC [Sedimentisphaerales bacterium]HOC64525.1 flagellar basal body rod protein FlgC [Sedimentisphaerales bacterium]HOH63388.1 flagellar basal body rod protein FlgC [Sedimentisphaerales bacterium]HPY48830.1 flagellar basal body rod protein FlgC [Sedimentisphaerales bacterium]
MRVDSTFGPVDIAVSGMRAQNTQMELISSNIANARTIDNGQGQPYRRLQALLRTENEDDDGIAGVAVGDIAQDMGPLQQIFDPGNPKADAAGYIAMPNVQLPVEMINLSTATRAYQANAAILKRYQKMVETTLELLR